MSPKSNYTWRNALKDLCWTGRWPTTIVLPLGLLGAEITTYFAVRDWFTGEELGAGLGYVILALTFIVAYLAGVLLFRKLHKRYK